MYTKELYDVKSLLIMDMETLTTWLVDMEMEKSIKSKCKISKMLFGTDPFQKLHKFPI